MLLICLPILSQCSVLESKAFIRSLWLYLLPKNSTLGTAANLLTYLCNIPALPAHRCLQKVFQDLLDCSHRLVIACLQILLEMAITCLTAISAYLSGSRKTSETFYSYCLPLTFCRNCSSRSLSWSLMLASRVAPVV